MSASIPRSIFLSACLMLVFCTALVPLQGQAAHCSTAKSAGEWAYTYTGTIVTANVLLPVAAVGHFSSDTGGNIIGSQSRSIAGGSAVEDISGAVNVNSDCTATATINVLVNGQVQRTSVLAVVYDANMTHARAIFQSLTLPDGTNVPVVITSDNTRITPVR